MLPNKVLRIFAFVLAAIITNIYFTTVELNTHLIYFNHTDPVFVLCELIYDTKCLPEGFEKICCSAGTKSFTPLEYRR